MLTIMMIIRKEAWIFVSGVITGGVVVFMSLAVAYSTGTQREAPQRSSCHWVDGICIPIGLEGESSP
jgi:hypothetical protein